MKNILLAVITLFGISLFGQIPPYYSSIDFSLEGLTLKNQLTSLITSTHTSPTSYSAVWAVLKESDLDPTNSSKVLLMYGYNDDDASVINDRTRNKNWNGGDNGEWNREHVFPKGLGSPNLGTSGPGSDPHNLRASDVQANGNRSSKKFASGAGNAGPVGPNWYPGDEWKGDAARIVMYMYLRYGTRCLPSAVTVGSSNVIDPYMINLLLDWNAEDDVSEFEINRNNVIFAEIGNRNPFIDNPFIANRIWGGTIAEDTWGVLSLESFICQEPMNNITIYPNPAVSDFIYVSTHTAVTLITVFDINGQAYLTLPIEENTDQIHKIDLADIPKGVFFVQINTINGVEIKKIILQ